MKCQDEKLFAALLWLWLLLFCQCAVCCQHGMGIHSGEASEREALRSLVVVAVMLVAIGILSVC